MKLKEKHENKYEAGIRQEEEKIAEIQAQNAGEINQLTAKPSLYHVVNYLANYFVRFLPKSTCLGCNKKLVCELKESILVDKMRPERSYCNHYMHHKCFDEYVNSPPFLRECPFPNCEYDFGSRNFKVDEGSVKSREKQYMQEEQKNGEEEEMYKLLGGY